MHNPLQPPARFSVLGVGVSALNLDSAAEFLVARAREGMGGYVCCCDARSIRQARHAPDHAYRISRALVATPDGIPLVWLGRRQGHTNVGRVYGPDLMLEICRRTVGTNLTHVLYGAAPGTVDLLADRLQARFPGLRITHRISPPFHPPTPVEIRSFAEAMHANPPSFIWVGISTPRQEAFMAACAPLLPSTVFLGVGAAFDFHAGRVRQAPPWVRNSGFEWLYRLTREPRRLWKRYLHTVPVFGFHAFLQITGLRAYPIEIPQPPAGTSVRSGDQQ